MQQWAPTIERPVEQESDDDVPTQAAWEDVEIISGDAYEFDEYIAEYCRATHKNAYDLLDAL